MRVDCISSFSTNWMLSVNREVPPTAEQVSEIRLSINCFPRFVQGLSKSRTLIAFLKMDGVDQLNNVLIIGMTNRMDMIDEALLRPGRLEVHIEISLPDEAGRFQILGIHTAKMKSNGVMASDVDIAELAALTKNFSGAEIGGLVKSATSFAFNRHVKVSTFL